MTEKELLKETIESLERCIPKEFKPKYEDIENRLSYCLGYVSTRLRLLEKYKEDMDSILKDLN